MNRIILSIILVGIASSFPIKGCASVSSSSSDATETVIEPLQVAKVESPRVPASMEFAGQNVDLDRLDMYERLDRELTAMTYTHGNTLLQIKRANRWFPVLEPILRKNGVPSDILYLACIESMLNPLAVSPAKAAGMWQFMPDTARQYGLQVDSDVDERYHVEKATAAACRYLLNAYKRYGNWETVAASYNGGMAGISRKLEAQMVNSAYDLHLVDETSRYMFRLLAAKLIMEHPADYGFSLSADQLYQPYDCKEIEVSGPVDDWAAWASRHGITYAQLRMLNPWIRSASLPNKAGKTYQVKIPASPHALSHSHSSHRVYNKNWVNDEN